MSMVYEQEARAAQAARAEQRRLDAAAAEQRRADRQRAADERAARLREQQRADQAADRAARAARREERALRRAEALSPERVYHRGTLALVAASGAGSLPAQIAHFVAISPVLLPLPLVVEGAAWVMAAGVAYADARGLPGWVRWVLRGAVVVCATFAAVINYQYGAHLPGLTASERVTAGWGLAAVTLLGPTVFEVRQWVATLAAATPDPDARARRRHARLRRQHHKSVARTADRLLSAAPFGSLSAEEAWERAWSIETGADSPGMTPDLHRRAVKSAARLREAQSPDPTPSANAEESPQGGVDRSPSELEESPDHPTVLAPDLSAAPVLAVEAVPTAVVEPTSDAQSPDSTPAVLPVGVVAAESARTRRATGRVPQSARTRRLQRTPDQLLAEAREATADWSADRLTADAIRQAVRTSAERARGLRDVLRAERAPAGEVVA
ncbi:hypothetical protein [Streptomyces buecherae]|uniref:hypothetical protein n=1 Tax=Streptomyces buecherae TaxID=2763006 RepID=UPI0036692806